MVNMINTSVNNSIYTGRRTKNNQTQAFQQQEVLEKPDVAEANKYADVQEIYEALKLYFVNSFATTFLKNYANFLNSSSNNSADVLYSKIPLG